MYDHDYAAGYIWRLADRQGIIPPFCLEIILKDSSHYYVHSVHLKDEETKSLIVKIWDLRAMQESDIDEIKNNLKKINDRSELINEKNVHPKLDWANLRIYLDNIMYCIEWHDRLWPEEERPQVGFKTS